ncbi:hypothetical protein B1R32_12532 [Abditibacterium utsteinense]|uniref:Uncharacterized protein n=1 Tax=Abditibacterium utsteinense TaxID=1960156 RepID=A0A2S8SPF8_9BACT|nr:hypothetical protein [Abditibacterium utsteinense]PQV62683.1 hypothetical protein B1R32_12532 [Abditibacterium utsteinense]
MKTNCFDVARPALTKMLLQIAVLPMTFVAVAHAAPVIKNQKAAVTQRPSKISNSAPLFKSSSGRVKPPKPRGMRVNIHSFFRINNSDDGFKDNDVEVYGAVNFKGLSVWRVARDHARTISNQPDPYGSGLDTTGPQRNEIDTGRSSFDVIFDQPSTWTFIVTGYLFDRDKASSDDALWNPFKMPQVINLKDLSERFKARRGGSYTLPGDRNSESADLFIVIDKSEDIF